MITYTHERKKGENLPPAFEVGEKKGQLLVLDNLGYSNQHGTRQVQKNCWWYQVVCSCGNSEVMNQPQLRDRYDCSECARDRKCRAQRKTSTVASNALPPGVPDFARMRW